MYTHHWICKNKKKDPSHYKSCVGSCRIIQSMYNNANAGTIFIYYDTYFILHTVNLFVEISCTVFKLNVCSRYYTCMEYTHTLFLRQYYV